MASAQDKLSRVRKPRVHITYQVETGGALEERELPFVVGVLGDFLGDSKPAKTLEARKFTQIDRDNFDKVMAGMAPTLNLKVDNTLAGDGSQIAVDLTFNKLEDFEPASIIKQVKPLDELLKTRNKLRDLLSKADRSPDLEELLEKALQDPGTLKSLLDSLPDTPATSEEK